MKRFLAFLLVLFAPSLAPAQTLGLIGDSHLYGANNFGAYAGAQLGYTVVGAGVPGATTQQILAQVPNVATASVVVVSAGTNDIPSAPWTGIPSVGHYYPQILTALAGKRVICVTVSSNQVGYDDHFIRAINYIIRRECWRAGAEVFDMQRLLADRNGLGRSALLFRDLLHMSDTGNFMLGALLAYQIAHPLAIGALSAESFVQP